jgi:hypothetical protein
MDPPIDSIHWKEMDDEQVLRFEAHWRRLTEDGHVRRGATVPEEALSSALALDDRYAHLRWLLAEALRRQGRLEESRVHYLAAMDLNPPSAQDRVPPRFVPVVDAAARASHAGFVDLWPVFAARARLPGLPDEDLFMDAIHPSPAGHALIADAVAEWARAARLRAPSGRGSP